MGHVAGNLSYSELADRVPYITGSFTGWKYKQMTLLSEFCKTLDTNYKDPLEVAVR